MNVGTIKYCIGLINVYGVKHSTHMYKIRLFHSSKNLNVSILPRTRKTIKRDPFELPGMSNDTSSEQGNRFLGFILAAIPVVTFILGTWQVKRYIWKLDLIKYLNNRISSEPQELPTDLHELESMEYCPVKVTGKYLHEREFSVCPKSLIIDGAGATEGKSGISSYGETNKGCYVITPFQLQDRDLTILVNRGWVRREHSHPSTRKSGQIQDVVEITGIVRLNEKRPPFIMQNDPRKNVWLYRDLNAMAVVYNTAPVFIDLVAKDAALGGPIGGQTRVSLRNEHLSYIITWYSLSAFTGICWYKQFIRKVPLFF